MDWSFFFTLQTDRYRGERKERGKWNWKMVSWLFDGATGLWVALLTASLGDFYVCRREEIKLFWSAYTLHWRCGLAADVNLFSRSWQCRDRWAMTCCRKSLSVYTWTAPCLASHANCSPPFSVPKREREVPKVSKLDFDRSKGQWRDFLLLLLYLNNEIHTYNDFNTPLLWWACF